MSDNPFLRPSVTPVGGLAAAQADGAVSFAEGEVSMERRRELLAMTSLGQATVRFYDESEARDESGKWTVGGAVKAVAGAVASTASAVAGAAEAAPDKIHNAFRALTVRMDDADPLKENSEALEHAPKISTTLFGSISDYANSLRDRYGAVGAFAIHGAALATLAAGNVAVAGALGGELAAGAMTALCPIAASIEARWLRPAYGAAALPAVYLAQGIKDGVKGVGHLIASGASALGSAIAGAVTGHGKSEPKPEGKLAPVGMAADKDDKADGKDVPGMDIIKEEGLRFAKYLMHVYNKALEDNPDEAKALAGVKLKFGKSAKSQE